MFTFDSGVTLSYEPGWGDVDTAEKWPEYVAQNGYGRVTQIRGGLGVVEEPDVHHTGQVMVVEGDYLIRVLGNDRLDGSVLLELADSIQGSGA